MNKLTNNSDQLKIAQRVVPVVAALGILGLLSFFVYLTATRSLTSLESVLLQFIFFAAGFGVSFWIRQKSVENAVRETIKPQARSAFRRLSSLYASLSRASTELRSLNDSASSEHFRVIFAKLDAIVNEQLNTTDDALEDWRDVVPEDVDELKQKLQSNDVAVGDSE
jgi:hypothetical protein